MAGCSIHPVPEDVTGVTTAGIVKQIRCETRDAVRDIVLRELYRLAAAKDPDPIAQDLYSRFQANKELMDNFNPNVSFAASKYVLVRETFDVILSSAIAYNFDLTMSEDNNLNTAALNLLGPWTSTFTLGLTGNANRQRKNERTFTITDRFGYLLTTLNTTRDGVHYCDGHIALGPSYVYPIIGRIGVYNTVYTFFQLSFFDGLAADVTKKAGGGSTPAMADVLTFNTAVDFSVAPKIVFSPIKGFNGFQVTDASGTSLARRTDVHQVTLAVALDSKNEPLLTSLRGFVFSGERGLTGAGSRASARGGRDGQVLILNRVTASTTSRASQIAVQMIDQLKSRELQLVPQ